MLLLFTRIYIFIQFLTFITNFGKFILFVFVGDIEFNGSVMGGRGENHE
jgi:hypothetical protein